jgi:uncharacterized protein (TIGR03435 family)
MTSLVLEAYGLKGYQLSDAPGWFVTSVYDIVATLPEGATQRQFLAMLQNLLIERFHLQAHRQSKEFDGYRLALSRSGAKLDEILPAAANLANGFLDKDGFPLSSRGISMVRRDGQIYMSGGSATIADLVKVLEIEMGRPVVDETGVTRKFDFRLRFSAEESHSLLSGVIPRQGPTIDPSPTDPAVYSGPGLLDALDKQLGLKLEKAKFPLEVLVVDHVDQTPTEN